MKTVKELKRTAMIRLGSCWGENVAIFFISAGGAAAAILAWILVSDLLKAAGVSSSGWTALAAAAALVLLWVLAEPFMYGVKWYRLQQVRGRSVHARSIFTCYGSWKRLGQIFRFSAALFVKRLYFTLPLAAALIGGAVLVTGIERDGGTDKGTAAAAAGIFLLAACLICLSSVLNRKYAAAPYLFVLEPKAPPKEIIGRSVRIMDGRTSYLSDAVFAAAAWLPPCILIFPAVFVLPYGQMIRTAAINEIIEAGKEEGRN